jgi:short-subunit dehydrogenase
MNKTESPKKIIIVGASSGIGKRMAEIYAGRGYRIGITARREELLASIKQEYPDNIEFESFDVNAPEALSRLEKLVEKIGGVDIFVISAGIGQPAKELVWEYDKMTIDTNVNAFAKVANWAFNYFARQGYGQLANISSVAANRGGHHAPAYNASKSFQSNYFEGIGIKAKKLKKDIAVTSIEPGFVDTNMSKSETIFWLIPVDKAARQIIRAIDRRKRKVYISRRWGLIARAMRWAPHWLYSKV